MEKIELKLPFVDGRKKSAEENELILYFVYLDIMNAVFCVHTSIYTSMLDK